MTPLFFNYYEFYLLYIYILKLTFKIISLSLHSIEVTVQDTKIIDGLSSAITEKNVS